MPSNKLLKKCPDRIFSVVRYFFLQSLGIYLSGGNIFFHLTLCLRTRVSKVAVTFPARNQIFKSNRVFKRVFVN